jgi:VanZ family protein
MPATYAVTIFTLSSLSTTGHVQTIPTSDKIMHMGVFGLMGVFVAMAVHRPGRPFTWRGALLAIFITSSYGVLDEFHQSMVPSRFASGHDALADFAGAAIAVGWYWVFARNRRYLSIVLGSD